MARSRPTLALTMMVKNEAENIARSIASARDIVDEILVVDTGSTDDTVLIAEAAGARVIHVPWTDDFSAPRNVALETAGADWVLVLDADEELAGGEDSVPDLLRDRFHWGYISDYMTATGRETIAHSVDRGKVTRLFRRLPDIRFRGIIHERPSIPKERKAECGLVICHFGPTLAAKKDRTTRNTALLEKAVAESPDDPYLLAKLGDEYHNIGDHQQACHYYGRSMEKLQKRTLGYAVAMMRNFAKSLFLVGARPQARQLLAALQEEHPHFVDLYFLDALMSAWEGDAGRARRLLEGCLRVGDAPSRYFSWGGCGGWRAAEALRALDIGGLRPL